MPSIPKQKRVRFAALALHDKGFWVVPVNGKVATKKDWPNTRVERNELEQILNDNADLGIGLVLSQSNFIDVECDDSDPDEAALLELFAGKIPPTPTWQSARGKHRLFLRDKRLPKKAKIDLGGVEFRLGSGKGACSVVPPSGERKWLPGLSLNSVQPAELPEHVIERLCATTPKLTKPSDSSDTIPEGQRNDTLFKMACNLRKIGMSEDVVADSLLALNKRVCDPPLPEAEVQAIAHSAATDETAKPKVGFLNRLLGDVELWHCDNDEPFVTLPQCDHKENWKIGKRNKQFRRWLSGLYYKATGDTLSANDLAEIATLLESRAIFDGLQHKLWRRVAEYEGKFYLDLGDKDWRAVEIDGDGWRVISDPPVKFFRARAMQSLPEPKPLKKSESLKSLLGPFLNLDPAGLNWPLIGGWLVAALRPRGPYPVLKLLGEQGSAKTTTARVLRQLIDPNQSPVRAEPKSTRDLMIQSNNAYVMCLDNLSAMKNELSDALCRLATGGGFSARTLYSDDDETIFEATRPVILTSIEEIAVRSDLLERSLIIELPTIGEAERKAEKQFWADFEKVQPRILGALLDVVSDAIRRLPEIEQKHNAELSRLADFEQWGEAAELELGLAEGQFVEAYCANREAATHLVLESNPVIAALLKYLKKNSPFEGTATRLLEKLSLGNYELKGQQGWPKSPRVLSQILKRIAPNLRQIGITAVRGTSGTRNDKKRVWVITDPSAPSKKKPSKTKVGINRDGGRRGSRGRKITR
jgi:primase-like protein/bifunctional DNA primase/polymerase-like protein